jgi:hypothetical protein
MRRSEGRGGKREGDIDGAGKKRKRCLRKDYLYQEESDQAVSPANC